MTGLAEEENTGSHGEPAGGAPGAVIALTGGHGAPGRTTLAVSLAAALGAAAPAIVVDADAAGPSVAAVADGDPTRNLSMLAHADPATADGWERAIARESQPLGRFSPHGQMLCGVPKPEMGGAIAPHFFRQLIAELRRRYRYVLLDAGATAPGGHGGDSAIHRPAVAEADHVLLVATPDIVGLLHARRALDAMRAQASVPPDRAVLVLNRFDARHHSGRREVEWALELPAAAVIPHDHRAAQAALAAQRPLVLARRSRAAGAILDFASTPARDRGPFRTGR